MATPRLGLVVEDKPTELSCTCSHLMPIFLSVIVFEITKYS